LISLVPMPQLFQ